MSYAPGGTADRGYHNQHKRTRATWAPIVNALEVVCWRCGLLIVPDPDLIGDGWDLGHNDPRTAYTGPEHSRCNRAAGGRRSKRVGRTTRRWLSAPRIRSCVICGVTYRVSYQDQRTCGRACGVELQRRNRPPKPPKPPRLEIERMCVECGASFMTRYSKKLTCSPKCRVDYHRRQCRERYVPIYSRRGTATPQTVAKSPPGFR